MTVVVAEDDVSEGLELEGAGGLLSWAIPTPGKPTETATIDAQTKTFIPTPANPSFFL
jgi:hypothetical protein